jgi:hypothetical protein
MPSGERGGWLEKDGGGEKVGVGGHGKRLFALSYENSRGQSILRTRAMLAVHFLRLDWARYLCNRMDSEVLRSGTWRGRE